MKPPYCPVDRCYLADFRGTLEAVACRELAQEEFLANVEKAKVRIRERRARWFKWFPWRLSIVRRNSR